MIDSILQDLRYAVRRLRNAAGFTSVIVLTLALGIGATAATFSLVDAAVLRPLPFPGADALVRLREVTPQGTLAEKLRARLGPQYPAPTTAMPSGLDAADPSVNFTAPPSSQGLRPQSRYTR